METEISSMETKVAVCKREEQKERHILNLMENAQTGNQLDGFLVDRRLITIKQQQKTVETRYNPSPESIEESVFIYVKQYPRKLTN